MKYNPFRLIDGLYNRSGIYQIKCIINGGIYVGSASKFGQRKNTHYNKLRDNIHENKKLQNAYNKYGELNMLFQIIEFVDNKDQLTSREQFYIDTLNPRFNICKVANRTSGLTAWNKGIPMPKHVIAKQLATKKSRIYEKQTISEEHKRAIATKNSGRPKTELQRMIWSKLRKVMLPWNKGIKGAVISTQRKAVIQLTIAGDFVAEYSSIAEAEIKLGCRANITNACRENRVSKGFKWKYKEVA